MAVVADAQRHVLGIFTDGDLRRAVLKHLDLKKLTASDVMTRNPRTMSPGKLVDEAVEMMERYKINQIPVVDDEGALVGALNMHDLFQAKAV